MMRAITGGISGIFVSLYLFLFAIPLISSEHTSFANPLLINSTDPTVVTSFALGNGFYQAMPLIPVFIVIFIWISIALKRDPGE